MLFRSKYKIITWEQMAFCSKVSELIARCNCSLANDESINVARVDALQALQASCLDSVSLLAAMCHATNMINKVVPSMDTHLGFILQQKHVVSTQNSVRMLKIVNSPRSTNSTELMILRCGVTGQPLITPDSLKAGAQASLFLPMSSGANVTRGVIFLSPKKQARKVFRLSPATISFLEAAAVILGNTMEDFCQKYIVCPPFIRSKRPPPMRCPISIRDVYRYGLVRINHELVCSSRVSIWQLRDVSIKDCVIRHQKLLPDAALLSLDVLGCSTVGLKCSLAAVIYLNDLEIDRVFTVAALNLTGEFEQRRINVELPAPWFSSLLRIELWRVEGANYDYLKNFTALIGLLELHGSYYLHSSAHTRSFALVDANRTALQSPVSLSLSLKLDVMSDKSSQSRTDYRSITDVIANHKRTAVVRASITNTPCVQGRYVCVFFDEQGLELGRTPTSHMPLHGWANLRILVEQANSRLSLRMRVELQLTPLGTPPTVIARADLSDACLIYFPRNRIEVKLSMRTSELGKLNNRCNIKLRLRIEQIRCPRHKDSSAGCLTDATGVRAVSFSRLVNGVVEFCCAPVDAGAEFLASAIAACDRGSPHIVQSNIEGCNMVICPFYDLNLNAGGHSVGPSGGTRFAVVVASAPTNMPRQNVRLVCNITQTMEASLRRDRLRDLRDKLKLDTSNQISTICNGWTSHALPDVIDNTLYASSRCLPGHGVYISILQPSGNELVCVACNSLSEMCGRVLQREHCASFQCIDHANKNTLVLTKEAELHAYNKTISSTLPFVCVPLKHNGSVIGVLGADSFDCVSKAAKAPKVRPEDGTFSFLQQLGANIGRAVDSRRKLDAIAMFRMDRIKTDSELLKFALEAILCNTSSIHSCEIWEMTPERQFNSVMTCKSQRVLKLSTAHEIICTRHSISVQLSHVAMGRLLDCILRRSNTRLVSLGSTQMMVPLSVIPSVRVLVLNVPKQFQPHDSETAYVLAIARACVLPFSI